jgi:IMP cyclohydrolase
VALQLNEQETTPCVQMINRQLVVGSGAIISSLAEKPEFSKVTSKALKTIFLII